MEAAVWTKHTLKLSSMLCMLFQFVAFPYIHHRECYEASIMKGWDLKKWVRASLSQCCMTRIKVSSVHSWALSPSSHSFFNFFLKFKNKNILKRKSQKNLKTWENNIKTQMALIVCCVYFKLFFLKLKLAVLYHDEYLRFF